MVYFFYGDDQWAAGEAVKKIIDGFSEDQTSQTSQNASLDDLQVVKFDGLELTPEKLKNELMTVGFFQLKKIIIIENLLENKKKTDVEAIIKLVDSRRSLPRTQLRGGNDTGNDNDIIFLEKQKPDKRGSAFKELSKIAQTREFQAPNQFELVKRIESLVSNNQSQISKEAVVLLSAMLPSDSLRLVEEIKKLSLLRYQEEISKEDISEMVQGEVSPDIFNFVESLATKNLKNSYLALNKLLLSGANENYILTMIVWQYRNLLIISDLLERNQASATKAGLNPYTYNKSLPLAKRYTFDHLKQIYSKLAEVDFKIKTGVLGAKQALELLAAELAS